MEFEVPTEKSIWLWEGDPPASAKDDRFRPWLDPYPVDTEEPLGAVLVCPGGGYEGRAPHEGKTIAKRFNDEGIHAFVVHYRVLPNRYPAPVLDAFRAIRIIRARAGKWNVNPKRVAVCGFSAGGHLAACTGTHFGEDFLANHVSPEPGGRRPDALILCYPVITSGPYTDRCSISNLLGEKAPESLWRRMSLELEVTEETPPAFLWHTLADSAVPVENSLLFAQALRRHGVPFELHVYCRGEHGLGIGEQDLHVSTWMSLCCFWLREMGWVDSQRT